MIAKIKAYKYEDLDHQSQFEVLTWLDQPPLLIMKMKKVIHIGNTLLTWKRKM